MANYIEVAIRDRATGKTQVFTDVKLVKQRIECGHDICTLFMASGSSYSFDRALCMSQILNEKAIELETCVSPREMCTWKSDDYKALIDDMRHKLDKPLPHPMSAKERKAYAEGIQACMSIASQHNKFGFRYVNE